jgi:hypothetical protein
VYLKTLVLLQADFFRGGTSKNQAVTPPRVGPSLWRSGLSFYCLWLKARTTASGIRIAEERFICRQLVRPATESGVFFREGYHALKLPFCRPPEALCRRIPALRVREDNYMNNIAFPY